MNQYSVCDTCDCIVVQKMKTSYLFQKNLHKQHF